MIVLYSCLFYIVILILSNFDPTSITFTFYYYLPEQKTLTHPLLLTPRRMESAMMTWPRGEVVVCSNLIESEDNLTDSEAKKLTQKSMTYEKKKHRRAPCCWRREEWELVGIVFESAMMTRLREGGEVCKFNWEWVNLIDSERKGKKQSITYGDSKHCCLPPAVNTAQDLSLSLSSVKQQWWPGREEGGSDK